MISRIQHAGRADLTQVLIAMQRAAPHQHAPPKWSGNGDEIMCWVTLFDVGLGGPIELPGIKMKTKSEL